jgi:hypothetical protein
VATQTVRARDGSEELVRLALDYLSHDNVTVIVVALRWDIEKNYTLDYLNDMDSRIPVIPDMLQVSETADTNSSLLKTKRQDSRKSVAYLTQESCSSFIDEEASSDPSPLDALAPPPLDEPDPLQNLITLRGDPQEAERKSWKTTRPHSRSHSFILNEKAPDASLPEVSSDAESELCPSTESLETKLHRKSSLVNAISQRAPK